MVRKKVFILIGIVMFVLVGVAGWFGYQYLTQPTLPPLQAVPVNAVALLKVNGPALLWEKLSGENQVWASLRKTSTFSRISSVIRKADSALRNDKDLHRIFEDKELIISLNPLNDTAADFLFILELPVPYSTLTVNHFIGKFGRQEDVNGSKNLRKVTFKGATTPFFYYISNGLFVGSYAQPLTEASLLQLASRRSLADDEAFAEVSRTAGKNVDANLFIQFSRLPGFLRSLSSRALVPGFDKLRNFARWSGLDLMAHPEQLLLSGYTRPQGSDFLKLFRNQKPGVVSSVEMLPANTAYLAAFSFDDFNTFADSYNNYLSAAGPDASQAILLRASTVQNLKDADLSELLVAQVNGGFATVPENSLVVIKSRNADQLTRMLNQTIPTSLQKKVLSINGREVRAIRFADFFGRFLHNVMPDFDQVFYFRLDDYFIFCPSADNIHQMLISYLTGQTLANDPAYKRFSEGMSAESNIYLYYNTSRSIAFHHYLFDDSTAAVWDKSVAGLNDMEGVGLQFSGADELFFTHIAVKHKTDAKAGSTSTNPNLPDSVYPDSGTMLHGADTLPPPADSLEANYDALWEAVLPAAILRQPYLVKSHRMPGNQGIVAFAANNTMSLIDQAGKILWTKELPERPLGGVHSIDYFRNGKIQYLFNSINYLYLIDANGNAVKPFPVKLPEMASAPLSVVEGKAGDYKIFVPGESHTIFAFKPNGLPDQTWKKPRLNQPLAGPLRHLREANHDYLVIPEANGQATITNLKGEPVMPARNSFTNNSHSTFYINETNSKGVFLTTDDQGKLVYIQAGGSVEKTVFDNFSRDHLFVYGDFNRDGSHDFIYVDGGQLVVYDRFKNVLLQHNFRSQVSDAPELIQLKNQTLLGVFIRKTSEIMLFDHQGLYRQLPFRGSTPFVVLRQSHLPYPVLVTAGTNRVWGYRLTNE